MPSDVTMTRLKKPITTACGRCPILKKASSVRKNCKANAKIMISVVLKPQLHDQFNLITPTRTTKPTLMSIEGMSHLTGVRSLKAYNLIAMSQKGKLYAKGLCP
jgi:hypothetical protein